MSFNCRGPLIPRKAPCWRPNPLFQGRQKELDGLTAACLAEQTRYSIVYGSGQSGKTSLLLHLEQQLRESPAEKREEPRVYTCWADFQRISGVPFSEVCQFLATEILKGIPELRGIEVPPTFRPGGALFDDWLYDLPIRNRRVVLLLEELGCLRPETRTELGNLLRSMFNSGTQRTAVVLFGGIELFQMVTIEVPNLHALCEKIYLEDLNPSASRAVLATGLDLALDTAERMPEFVALSEAIYGQVEGHPYLTHHFGASISMNTTTNGRPRNENMVAKIAGQLFGNSENSDYYFESLFEAIRQKKLVEDCCRLLDRPPSSGLDPAMVMLRLLGVAKLGPGVWTVRNRLLEGVLKTWLLPAELCSTVPRTSSEKGTNSMESVRGNQEAQLETAHRYSNRMGKSDSEQVRRVDAVVPSEARFNETIDLYVQVRLPHSPLLSIRDLPLKRKPPRLEHDSRGAVLEFPRNQRTGGVGAARLRVRVVAPDFTFNDDSEKIILVPPGQSSELAVFTLTAKHQGECRINVEILDLSRALVGTIFLATSVGELAARLSANSSSLELTVNVKPMFDVFLSHRKIPDERRGLQQIAGCDNVSRALDIVFLHGLGGDSWTTWMADKEDIRTFWPYWLAQDFAQAGLWTFGYAANTSGWKAESMPLADRGTQVLELLANRGLGKRALVFITHSMGGIIVKQILRHAQSLGVSRWKAICDKTMGIIFIATPHSGAHIANFAGLASVVYRTNEHVDELVAHDSRLRELHGWFLNYHRQQKLICRSYCEKREVRPEIPLLGIKLPKGILVVDETSAEPNIPGERAIPLDEDHIAISKPLSRAADLYMSISGFLNECLETIARSQ